MRQTVLLPEICSSRSNRGYLRPFVVGSNTLTAFSLTKPVGSTSLGTFLRVLQSAVGDRLQSGLGISWMYSSCFSFCLAGDIFSPGEDGP